MGLLLQIYPNRVTITPAHKPRFKKQDSIFNEDIGKQISLFNNNGEDCKKLDESYVENFKKVKNSFIISKATKKKMIDSINTMAILSRKRDVIMLNKKTLYNFRMSFITLTLPSKQRHSDLFLKKECLNQMLIELRKYYNVKNYVWRAELQKNENIHFHLILDQYVDFQALRRRWNRILNKFGYVDTYSKKFQNMSLTEYHALRNLTRSCTFKKSQKAYAVGKKCNWTNPNSVDTRSITSEYYLALYIAKYLSKTIEKEKKSKETLKRELKFGRSWARSYSLVQVKYTHKYALCKVKSLIDYLEKVKDKVWKQTGDYFTVYYFQINKMHKNFIDYITKFCYENASLYNYPFPVKFYI